MSPPRRTRLWIDPPFQGRLLLRTGLHLFAYVLMVWHVGFVLETMREVARRGGASSVADLYVEYFWKQLPLLLTFILLVPVLLYDLLKFSHRIAGPLFRCRKVMEEMAAGKTVREFKPRKYDLMGELFAAFNGLIQAWSARVGSSNGHAPGNGHAANGAAASAAPPGQDQMTK